MAVAAMAAVAAAVGARLGLGEVTEGTGDPVAASPDGGAASLDGGAPSPDGGATTMRRVVRIDRSRCDAGTPLSLIYRSAREPRGGERPGAHYTLEVLSRHGDTWESLGRASVGEVNGTSAKVLLDSALDEERAARRLVLLRDLRHLVPEDPGTAYFFARHARALGDLEGAIDGYRTFLGTYNAPQVQTLVTRLEADREFRKNLQRRETAGLQLLWPPGRLTSLQADQILLEAQQSLGGAAFLIGATPRERLTIIVHRSRVEMVSLTCSSLWSGGLYDGAIHLPPTRTNPGVDPSALRHEVLHAALASTESDVPQWFEEGTADMFSGESTVPLGWTRMVQNRTWIPFSSLESRFQDFEESADASLAYAQSLAMVELLRECGGVTAISQARMEFEAGLSTAQVFSRACQKPDVTGKDLLEFLERRLKK